MTAPDLRITYRTMGIALFLALVWIWPAFVRPEFRQVAYPVATDISIFTLFFLYIWRRSNALPVFEIGAFFGVVSLLYAIVPSINFISGGGWTSLSDNRLLAYDVGPKELATFTWPYTAILAGFCGAYVLVRRNHRLVHEPVEAPRRRGVVAMIVVVFFGAQAYTVLFSALTGISLFPSYINGGLEGLSGYYSLPLIVQQITHNVAGILFAAKVCILVLLLRRWRYKSVKFLVAAWLLIELIVLFKRMGARTYTALLLLAFVIFYHRMVKPLTMKIAIAGAALFLIAFIAQGMLRTADGKLQNVLDLDTRVWTTNNDFQTMFASAYDVKKSVDSGLVPSPPWQVYLSDLFLVIPSQLLPFTKMEPSAWYYGAIHAGSSSMFGFRAQAVIGFGWPELLVRGALLGLLFGYLYRWYTARASSFWPTVGYAYALIWSHYIYRSTMLWPLYFVVYEFVTVMVMSEGGALLLHSIWRRARRRKDGAPAIVPVLGGSVTRNR